jgi:hypothetical protein
MQYDASKKKRKKMKKKMKKKKKKRKISKKEIKTILIKSNPILLPQSKT